MVRRFAPDRVLHERRAHRVCTRVHARGIGRRARRDARHGSRKCTLASGGPCATVRRGAAFTVAAKATRRSCWMADGDASACGSCHTASIPPAGVRVGRGSAFGRSSAVCRQRWCERSLRGLPFTSHAQQHTKPRGSRAQRASGTAGDWATSVERRRVESRLVWRPMSHEERRARALRNSEIRRIDANTTARHRTWRWPSELTEKPGNRGSLVDGLLRRAWDEADAGRGLGVEHRRPRPDEPTTTEPHPDTTVPAHGTRGAYASSMAWVGWAKGWVWMS